MKARGVAQNSAYALAGDLAVKGGIVAVMVVAGRGLSLTEFALFGTGLAAATVLTALLDLGSQTLLTRDGVRGPEVRGEMLRALTLARTPILAVAIGVAVVAGVAAGQALIALATVILATAGAAQLSLTGALRSAQDLQPEAVAKLASGVLMLSLAGLCLVLAPTAGAMLLAVAGANVAALIPMIVVTRRVVGRGPPVSPWLAIRRAAPLGAMGLATLAYYRAGTIALSWLSTSVETAHFAAATTLAWGLMCVGNALTTGLLPRLSAASSAAEQAMLTRRALIGMTALAVVLGVVVICLASPLMALLFGARYGSAGLPLALLAGATMIIAPTAVMGVALVATGHLRPLGVQVFASLAVNLAVLGALVPTLGAAGAAWATIVCEAVALGLVTRAATRALPGLMTPPKLILRGRTPVPVEPSR